MPKKITFNVVYVTSKLFIKNLIYIIQKKILGEDTNYRSNELNTHGPTVKGWRSIKNSNYPQEIILQLNKQCILNKIQILAHQYMIRTLKFIGIRNKFS